MTRKMGKKLTKESNKEDESICNVGRRKDEENNNIGKR